MSQWPDERLVDPVVVLERSSLHHLDSLQAALIASHPELHVWMDWAGGEQAQSAETTEGFIRERQEWWESGSEYSYAMTAPGTDHVMGTCGLMRRIGEGGLEIGYWVRTDVTGRGIATAATRLLTDAAFGLPDIERVEIHHDEANGASGRVPEKLGYEITDRHAVEKVAPAHTGINVVWTVTREAWT